VAKGGDRPALHYFQNTLSHAELGQSSDALAAALVAEEIEPGDRVGVYLQNVPQYPIAMLAIWKLGAVMVCLSPMMKAGELNYQLKDSGARAVIAHESAVHVVAEAARQTEAHLTITTSNSTSWATIPSPSLSLRPPPAPRGQVGGGPPTTCWTSSTVTLGSGREVRLFNRTTSQ
jgi:long-chain acyl-CoA synthetase